MDQNTTEYLEDYEKKKKAFLEKEKESGEPPISLLDTESGDAIARNAIEIAKIFIKKRSYIFSFFFFLLGAKSRKM